ncbi:MAG: glycoside hydrolase family 27 protein [Prevotellaceae bacterium]|jgi:alpha-galactosidase|nr:glycoside hydrolase family 27 protein [Prevotellaceae bacterium]
MNYRKYALLAVVLLFSVSAYAQKFEGLAETPAMGWNSWNKFAGNITEDLIKGVADAIVESGLRDAGYIYVNLDDCWHGERDSLGFIQCDPVRFPSGIKALADYMHERGLKLGIYSDAGWKTCAGRPGSVGHEFQDALQYAKWGVDYLKYDWCDTPNINAKGAYKLMSEALRAAGRPIYFSMCEWGTARPWEWASEIAHSWRTTGDIWHCFDCGRGEKPNYAHSVMAILDMQEGLRKYAGPGHWNDPDMLEVGNGLSESEDRAHFTMWCMLAASLILGNDVRDMPQAIKEVIMNKEVIAIDQDKEGIQGLRFMRTDDGLEFWFKPLVNGEWAFCILNRATEDRTYDIDWQNFNLYDDVAKRFTDFDSKTYKIRNLWTKKDDGDTKKSRVVTIPAHDVLLYRLTPTKK